MSFHPVWAEVRPAWEIAADRVGGHLEPRRRGDYDEEGATIATSMDAVDLTISHGERFDYTEIRAFSPDSAKLALTIWPRFKELPPTEHWQKVFSIGEAAFDSMFILKANITELARGWLDEDILRRLSRAVDYGFILENEVLRAVRNRMEADPSDLVNVVRAAAALASSGTTKNIPRWRSLASKIGGELKIEGERWLPGEHDLITWEVGTRDIRLIVSRSRLIGNLRGLWLCTQVRAHHVVPSMERFVVGEEKRSPGFSPIPVGGDLFAERYVVLTSEPTASRRRFAEEICRKIAALEPQYIESDGENLSIGFKGFEMTAERLVAAGELAATLAQPVSRTAYR